MDFWKIKKFLLMNLETSENLRNFWKKTLRRFGLLGWWCISYLVVQCEICTGNDDCWKGGVELEALGTCRLCTDWGKLDVMLGWGEPFAQFKFSWYLPNRISFE